MSNFFSRKHALEQLKDARHAWHAFRKQPALQDWAQTVFGASVSRFDIEKAMTGSGSILKKMLLAMLGVQVRKCRAAKKQLQRANVGRFFGGFSKRRRRRRGAVDFKLEEEELPSTEPMYFEQIPSENNSGFMLDNMGMRFSTVETAPQDPLQKELSALKEQRLHLDNRFISTLKKHQKKCQHMRSHHARQVQVGLKQHFGMHLRDADIATIATPIHAEVIFLRVQHYFNNEGTTLSLSNAIFNEKSSSVTHTHIEKKADLNQQFTDMIMLLKQPSINQNADGFKQRVEAGNLRPSDFKQCRKTPQYKFVAQIRSDQAREMEQLREKQQTAFIEHAHQLQQLSNAQAQLSAQVEQKQVKRLILE